MGEAGFYHWLGGAGDDSGSYSAPAAPYDVNKVDFSLADPERLHFTYLNLLEQLELSPNHYVNLCQRGLSDEAICFNRYKSLPANGRIDVAARVASEGKVAGVPGFFKGSSGVELAGQPGLLLPVLNIAQQIVGMQIRRDDYNGEGSKYIWLSSSGRSYGCGPGTPTHVSIPEKLTTRHVFVTEGILKADVVAFYTGAVVIGIPGVTIWGKALKVLAELLPLNVILAFDNDRFSNEVVERSYEAFKLSILSNHFNAYVALWDKEYKGLDDWLCATQGKEPLKLQCLFKATLEKKQADTGIHYKESLAKSYKTEFTREKTKPAHSPLTRQQQITNLKRMIAGANDSQKTVYQSWLAQVEETIRREALPA